MTMPILLSETDDRFYIAPSNIHLNGKGIFARNPIPIGEGLEVIGVLVPAKSVSDLCTQYADSYKLRCGEYLLIPVGFGGLVNHSTSPNMEKVFEGDKVLLRAIRNIEQDEELSFTYSEFAQEMLGLKG